MTPATDYLYDHVTPKILLEDMTFSERAPKPGDRMPSFDLPAVSGERINSDRFAGRKALLLMTGSYSCPMTASANPPLKDIYKSFGHDIEFVMLHVREAHPGEYLEQPRSAAQKFENAQALKERDQLPWSIAVDDPEGTVHRLFDEKPNAVWLADRDGVIVYRALWAGDESGLIQALEAVSRGNVPLQQESLRKLTPMAMGLGRMREMTLVSGPRAAHDLWAAAPPMAAVALGADFFRPLPPKWRTFAAIVTFGIAVSALVSAAARGSRR